MMRKIFWLIIIFNNSFLLSQQTFNFKLYYQKKEDTITLLIDNQDSVPYSLEFFIEPHGQNLQSIGQYFSKNVFIEANTKGKRLAQFVPIDPKKSFEIKDISFIKLKKPFLKLSVGNIWKTDYDENYEYDLPYNSKEMFLVAQGYDGSLSHQNQYALDFEMPVGTEVLAAREGIVIEVKQDSNTGCADISCAKYGNYIKIIHKDGTIGEYYHLKMNSSKVNVGDPIQRGQAIAVSGNTGWSTGPHLHFMCYLPRPNGKNISIKTLFRINNGQDAKYLIQGNKYKKNY